MCIHVYAYAHVSVCTKEEEEREIYFKELAHMTAGPAIGNLQGRRETQEAPMPQPQAGPPEALLLCRDQPCPGHLLRIKGAPCREGTCVTAASGLVCDHIPGSPVAQTS